MATSAAGPGGSRLASRLSRLGTETAFAVSAEAAALAATGRRVYPFHLGDLDLPTPRNIIDAAVEAIESGRTGYAPSAGIPALRRALAEEVNRTHGTAYGEANVAVQPGGKPSIGKLVMAVVDPGDEVLYPNPGFPIYESQIEFHGGVAVPYGFRDGEEGFELDLDGLEAAVTPRTRILIYNDLHNPTGAASSPEEMARLAALAREHDLVVLADEAYFDIRFDDEPRSLVSEPGLEERTLILYTFSKRYAMTGWRIGASIGPADLIEAIARLNVNDESCSNHFVQYAALEALTGDQTGAKRILETLHARSLLGHRLLDELPGVRCHRPRGSFYLYPDVTEVMDRAGLPDYEDFRRAVLHETGVAFCTRLHFGRPLPGERRRHVRLAYSGISEERMAEGLERLGGFLGR